MDATAERIHKMVSTLNYTELDELIALAQREREGKLEQARRSLMAEFEEKAASIGLTPDQLFGQARGGPEKGKRGKKGEQHPLRPGSGEVPLAQRPDLVRTRPQADLADPGRSRRAVN